jgi:hypothetical protein
MSNSLAAGAGCGSTTPMNDRTAAVSQAGERTAKPHRGGPSGRQVVGDYVGQHASDAAQAVRRAGLRPGLDRSFGCAPELVGQVVEQEPTAGSDLARNGLVTLYVAAPGVAEIAADEHPAPASPPVPAALDATDEDAPSSAEPRRRRKPGRATRAPQVFGTAPAPVAPGGRRSSGARAQDAETASEAERDSEAVSAPAWPGEEEPREEVGDERAGDELTEEFVVHVDDLFAGRERRAWRRVYPRRGLRVQLAGHPWLFGIVAAMLAAWVVVGVAAALSGHSPNAHHGSAPRAIVKHSAARPIDSGNPSPSRRPAVHRAGHENGPSHRRAAPVAVVRPAWTAAVRSVPAAPQKASAPVAPAPAHAAPAPVTPPPAPAAEPARGGLFSP